MFSAVPAIKQTIGTGVWSTSKPMRRRPSFNKRTFDQSRVRSPGSAMSNSIARAVAAAAAAMGALAPSYQCEAVFTCSMNRSEPGIAPPNPPSALLAVPVRKLRHRSPLPLGEG